jgi:hypothetical protein
VILWRDTLDWPMAYGCKGDGCCVFGDMLRNLLKRKFHCDVIDIDLDHLEGWKLVLKTGMLPQI